jgi:hypothetical protein
MGTAVDLRFPNHPTAYSGVCPAVIHTQKGHLGGQHIFAPIAGMEAAGGICLMEPHLSPLALRLPGREGFVLEDTN